MAIIKNTNDLLTQAATNQPDNTTQQISPADVREMSENLAVSNYNKITDAALVGLKDFSTLVAYESGQGITVSGELYISNKVTGPGAFNASDWDLYADLSAADQAKLDFISVTSSADLDQMQTDIAALEGARINKGTFSPSGGVFPGGGTAQDGWTWIAIDDGIIDGMDIKADDAVVAIIDNAGTGTAADWHLQDNSDKVNSVNGKIGTVVVNKTDVGLSNVPNTDFTAAVAANTAKVTNATHSGEVSGSGALTAQPTIISNKTTLGSLSGTEEFLINDGGVLKKVLASNVGGGDTIFTGGTMSAPSTITMGNNNLQFLSSGSGVFKVDANGNSGGVNFYEYRGSLSTTPKLIQRQTERGDWSVGSDLLVSNSNRLGWSSAGTLSTNVTQNGIKNFIGLYNNVETFSVDNRGHILAGENISGKSYLSFTSTLGMYLKGAINSAQPILRGADQNGNVVLRLNNSGYLAVGHDAPTAKLHVKGTGATSGTTALLVQNGAGTPNDLLKVANDGSTTIGGDTQINGLTTINNGATNTALELQGNTSTRILYNGSGLNWFTGYASSVSGFAIENQNIGNLFIISDNGNIGFGTQPNVDFHFRRDDVSGTTMKLQNSTGDFRLQAFGLATTKIDLELQTNANVGSIWADVTNGLRLRTNGSDRLVVNRVSGNVGINVTPTAKLQVKGTDQLGTSTALLVQDGAGTPNDLLKVANDGSTTINGQTRISNSSGTGKLHIKGSTGGDTLVVNTDSSSTSVDAINVVQNDALTSVFKMNAQGASYWQGTLAKLHVGASGTTAVGTAMVNIKGSTNTSGGRNLYIAKNNGDPLLYSYDNGTFALAQSGIDFNCRLQVQGLTTTSGARALVVENSGGQDILVCRNDNAIGLYGATPVVQATTAIVAPSPVGGGGTTTTDTDTFEGYTMSQVVKALRNLGILA